MKFPKLAIPFLGGNRPAHTLVYVGATEVVRLETDARGAPLGGLHCYDRHSTRPDDIPDAVAFVLRESQMRFGRKVWVLSEALSTYSFGVPAAQVTGLPDESLQMALAFELESLMDVAAANHSIAFRALPSELDMQYFWLTIAPHGLIDQVSAAARSGGGRLAGLLHPGGLPRPLARAEDGAAAAGSWWRMEYWARNIVAQRASDATTITALDVFPADARTTQREMDRWLQARPQPGDRAETLAQQAIIDANAGEVTRRRLDQPEDLRDWLAAWATALSGAEPDAMPAPVLQLPRDAQQEYVLSAAFGAAALALAIGHYTWYSFSEKQARKQVETLKQVEAGMKTAQTSVQKAQTDLNKLREELDLIEAGQTAEPRRVLEALRERPVGLLEALGGHRPPDVLIDRITLNAGDTAIGGIALRYNKPDRLGQVLAPRLRSLAWTTDAPIKTNLDVFPDSGPWRFELKLPDLGLETFYVNRTAAGTQP